VVEAVRGAVADVQQRALALQKTVSGLDYQPQALRQQATQAVTASVDVLGKDAQARRRALESRVAELGAEAKDLPTRLQKLVDDQVATAGMAYDGLVKRGETLVGRIRRQQSTSDTVSSAKTTSAKAKTTRTQAAKTARSASTSAARTTKRTTRKTAEQAAQSPARSSAKATASSAKKTVSNATQAATEAAEKLGD
jgi:DNA-binding protein HU-beta